MSFCIFLDAGSDLQGIRTNAKRDGDDFILNGSKVFITNGILADVVVVVAITDANAKANIIWVNNGSIAVHYFFCSFAMWNVIWKTLKPDLLAFQI